MDTQAFTQLVSSIGFPIVACMIMWKSLQDSTAAHKEEMDGMKESLNQNTLVLSELKQMIKDFKESLPGGKGTDE
jgi:predicted translin family RNA/ssDNA-binding protein